ncbi:uncharacterized protein BXZ73DRAFT_104788 [Epithele typhae]|uniref:uncharacterized protein n=1 Tax=Epithele typhae TaxID=378194 RepID=UPI0020085EFF|nr:uncharacterized protein BXZ73DRAFT_104788 [Epithele typhae]KAH9919969.1 hypothetical protein BXZ73DRAFT_104788 [Epithele typhae]
MFCLSALSLAYPALSSVLAAYAANQTPLGPNGLHLKRLPFSHLADGRESIDQVLRAVELAGEKVWNVGPSHIDVLLDAASHHFSLAPFLAPHVANAGTVPLTSVDDLPIPDSDGHAEWPEPTWSSPANATFHAVYHPLAEIADFMSDLAVARPDLVTLVNLGHSGEGREMYAIQISSTPAGARGAMGARKAGFVISGAQHAREWIATSTALYLAHSLVSDPTEEFSLSPWLEFFMNTTTVVCELKDFYVIPVPNPDGYVYTWEYDRLWYKNRQNIGPAERCTGIDMNRNWGHKWKAKSRLPSARVLANSTAEGVDDDEDEDEATWEEAKRKPGRGRDADPCSTWFPGHRPFEAPEVNNIANYITTLPALKAFVDLRSYGQMVSTPFSWSCKKSPKDAEDQMEAALGATNAIKQVHGTVFTTGSLCEQVYRASGNVVDYMYAKAGIKFAYAVHLRDTGTYGFSLPAEWIKPVGEETANMVRFLAGFISRGKLHE